jgi:hypothetical protein
VATAKTKWLAKEIIARYVSYHFTDWDEAVKSVIADHRDQDLNYTKEEVANAVYIAKQGLTQPWESWYFKTSLHAGRSRCMN